MRPSAFRLVAPAGAPLPARAVLRAAVPGRPAAPAWPETRHAFFVCSGRAALTVLLHALHAMSPRREVVIPAYTCFSVPSAIARAGLTVRLCDVDPKTLDLDPASLAGIDLSRVLGVVPSGLYGLPGDLPALEMVARPAGAFVVDDAAQCLGATLAGRPCGTFGDAGFYSLGRGKNVTTMGGGVLVTPRDDLAERIAAGVRALPRPRGRDGVTAVAGALLYGALLPPSRYWLVDRLPFLELGASHFEPGFPMAGLSTFQRRLADEVVPLAAAYNERRRHHAEALRAGIDRIEGVEIPRPVAGAKPVYLRFPVLARDAAHRASILARLRQAGIAASASYPTAVGDIPGIARYLAADQAPCPAAASIASRIVTLPTHAGVTDGDVERMIGVIRATS